MLHKRRYEGVIRRAAIGCFVIFCGFFLFSSYTVLALNRDYTDPDKWRNNPKAVSVPLEYENLGYTLKGSFSYITDDSLGIYTLFQISETTLSEDANYVTVTYSFHMPGEEYTVIAGDGGFYEDTPEEEKSAFAAEADFSNAGVYPSGVQYVGKEYDRCTVDIMLSVNGHNYAITENEALYGSAVPLELPTTLRETTAKAAKETTVRTSKASKAGTAASSKRESTTKFTPQYNITTTAKAKSSRSVAAAAEAAAVTDERYTEAQLAVSESLDTAGGSRIMGKSAKIALLIALLAAIIGTAVLITVRVIEGANKPTSQTEDETEEKA